MAKSSGFLSNIQTAGGTVTKLRTQEGSRYAIQNYTSQFSGRPGRCRGGKRSLVSARLGAF